jgi:hypothetical protein
MIDVKHAIQIAKDGAARLLDAGQASLEEIERDSCQGRDVWSITLGVERDLMKLSPVGKMVVDPLVYRRFQIDAETGELIAMKLREVATRYQSACVARGWRG